MAPFHWELIFRAVELSQTALAHTALSRKQPCICFSFALSQDKCGTLLLSTQYRTSPQPPHSMIALHSCRLCDAYHQTGISSNLSPWILWGIWTSQNLLLFENKSVTTRSMVVNAVVAAREWLLAQVVNTTKSSPTQTGNETPPTNPDVIYCNTDVAWSVSRRAVW